MLKRYHIDTDSEDEEMNCELPKSAQGLSEVRRELRRSRFDRKKKKWERIYNNSVPLPWAYYEATPSEREDLLRRYYAKNNIHSYSIPKHSKIMYEMSSSEEEDEKALWAKQNDIMSTFYWQARLQQINKRPIYKCQPRNITKIFRRTAGNENIDPELQEVEEAMCKIIRISTPILQKLAGKTNLLQIKFHVRPENSKCKTYLLSVPDFVKYQKRRAPKRQKKAEFGGAVEGGENESDPWESIELVDESDEDDDEKNAGAANVRPKVKPISLRRAKRALEREDDSLSFSLILLYFLIGCFIYYIALCFLRMIKVDYRF